MKQDQIQQDLLAWRDHGDMAAAHRALSALQQEWWTAARRFLSRNGPASKEEVDDAVQDALETRVIPSDKGQSKAIRPPEEPGNDKAWRRKVLHNRLRDRLRKLRRRRHTLDAWTNDISLEVEKAEWRVARGIEAEKSELASTLTDAPRAPWTPHSVPAVFDDSALQRQAVLRVLGELVIKRRVILSFGLRVDPTPHAGELASKLREPQAHTEARIRFALFAPYDGTHDHYNLPMVQVPWPFDPGSEDEEKKAKDSARKAFDRACKDVVKRLGAA